MAESRIHPVTDEILKRQRKILMRRVTPGTPIEVQRRISRELLWHAMHTVAMLDPTVDMQIVAEDMRDAISKGTARGVSMRIS